MIDVPLTATNVHCSFTPALSASPPSDTRMTICSDEWEDIGV